MRNPWQDIPLSDYEGHMSLGHIFQLQALNELMEGQVRDFAAGTVMILGIAGGNGLEHIRSGGFHRVWGVDVNGEYLDVCRSRFPDLSGVLELVQADLLAEDTALPQAELLIADLLVEYIGYDCFARTVEQVAPQYVSCVIQINTDASFVSDSPYLHAFDGLDAVHCQMEEDALAACLAAVGYGLIRRKDRPLPNGKKLVQLDFARMEPTQ